MNHAITVRSAADLYNHPDTDHLLASQELMSRHLLQLVSAKKTPARSRR
jgi:hypothetical protein